MNSFGGAIRNVEVSDFTVFGVPFDEKSSYLKGAAQGPDAIRAASTVEMINAWTELGVNLEEDAAVKDLGNLDTSGSPEQVFQRLEKKVIEVLDDNSVPVLLGGDHSLTFPAVKAVAARFTPLDILHFDAHPDLYDELYGDPLSHACPFRRILEKGLAAHLVQVGIRAGTGDHRKTAERFGVRTIPMSAIPPLPELVFSNPLYISLDVDALDPAFAPGVSHHEPGGLSTRQLLHMIHHLKAEIIGFDVVEVNPKRDRTGITAAAAAKLAMEIMGKIIHDRNSKR